MVKNSGFAVRISILSITVGTVPKILAFPVLADRLISGSLPASRLFRETLHRQGIKSSKSASVCLCVERWLSVAFMCVRCKYCAAINCMIWTPDESHRTAVTDSTASSGWCDPIHFTFSLHWQPLVYRYEFLIVRWPTTIVGQRDGDLFMTTAHAFIFASVPYKTNKVAGYSRCGCGAVTLAVICIVYM